MTPFLEFLSGLAGIFAKYAPVPLLAAALTTTTLLVLPEPWAEGLGLKEMISENRPVLAGAAIASWMYFVAAGLKRLWGLSGKLVDRWRLNGRRRGLLRDLAPTERGYLRLFVVGQTSSIRVHMEDGIAGGLQSKGVLYRHELALNHSVLEGMPVNLSDWVRAEIRRDPTLLEGATEIGRDGYGAIIEPGVRGRPSRSM